MMSGALVEESASQSNSFPFWSSRFLAKSGVLHFFTARAGGVSPPPYDSLNLGFSSQDEAANVAANRKRVQARFHVELRSLAVQVHGNAVLALKPEDSLPDPGHLPEADAILSNRPGLTIPMFFADCLPVFLWDPLCKAGGLAHAGWRSTLQDVGPLSVDVLCDQFGCKPENLLAAFGPSIGPCCFEVGPEVADPFQRKFGKEVVFQKNKKLFVDLWKANHHALMKKGVNGGNMELAGECTFCRRDLYFSYRRDKGKTGRMAGALKISN